MGAMKKLLPDNWFDITDDDIESVVVSAVGFKDTVTNDGDFIISNAFGRRMKTQEMKEFIETFVSKGFNAEIHLKNKEVLKINIKEETR